MEQTTNQQIEAGQSLACGARSLACFSYVDPTNVERSGVKLFCQACLCPAAVLAANESLIADEKAALNAHNIPCASGYAVGAKGLEVYSRTCRSQLMCGLLCMGLPVIYTENLIQRQRIREKYQLQHPNPCSEIGAGCCYPCSMFQSHTFLYVRRHQDDNPRPPSDRKGEVGPLRGGLAKLQAAAAASGTQSQEFAAGQSDPRNVIITPPPPAVPPDLEQHARAAALRESYKSPTKETQATRLSQATPPKGPPESESVVAAATQLGAGAATAVAAESSVGETPVPQRVMLFPANARGPGRKPGPTTSASSAESRSTPATSSIPPPEVTDSPRMGAPAPASSYTASSASHPDQDTSLNESALFQMPAMLPLPAMAKPPPTFAVPPALKPPDSADSEVMAAWMQGPKLSHLSQTLQRPANSSRNQSEQTSAPPVSRPRPAPSGGASGSEASLFSLDPSASHASPLPHHHMGAPPAPHPARAAPSAMHASIAVPGLPPMGTPGSSVQVGTYDTITSSKLSSMIDHAMLNGSGASAPRGSGGAGARSAVGSVDPSLQWDSHRHSSMEPIAETDGEGPGVSNTLPAAGQAKTTMVPASAEIAKEPPSAGLSASPRLAPSMSRNAARAGRGSGASAAGSSRATLSGSGGARVSGAARSSGFVPGVMGGVGGAALTVLARIGADCSSSGGLRPVNSSRNGSSSQRRTPAPPAALASDGTPGGASHAPTRTGASSKDGGRGKLSASAGEDFPVETSADNFSSLKKSGSVEAGPAAQAAAPYASPQPVAPQAQQQQQHHGYTGAGCGADLDDAVNFGTVGPSFMDGPDMEAVKEALRQAGQAPHSASTPPPPLPGPPALSSATNTPLDQQHQRVMTLGAAVNSVPRTGPSRYGAVAPAAPAESSTACGAVAAAASAARTPIAAADSSATTGPGGPYASYYAEGHSHDEVTGGVSMEDDASSAIDGPVSSGEGESCAPRAALLRPHGTPVPGTAAASRHRCTQSPISHDEGDRATATDHGPHDDDQEEEEDDDEEEEDPGLEPGDGTVSVMTMGQVPKAVATATATSFAEAAAIDADADASGPAAVTAFAGPTSSGAVGGLEPAESSAFTYARRSASGLSNGESNAEYDSVADSVSVSQQRQQKHWVNWMAQSVVSVGMSMTGSTTRNLRGVGAVGAAGRSGGVRASRMMAGGAEAAAVSSYSVNQRVPYPVAEEEPDEVSYGRWE